MIELLSYLIERHHHNCSKQDYCNENKVEIGMKKKENLQVLNISLYVTNPSKQTLSRMRKKEDLQDHKPG